MWDGRISESKISGEISVLQKQFERTMEFCAELCTKYKIETTPQTVLTHYEFGLQHPQTTSAGKIDIAYIPPYPWVKKEDVGSFIRAKVKWYELKNMGDKMETDYYNLAGGINQALTKTELGLDTKKIYWADAENVEILQNRGIVKQKGNSLFLDIGEEITGLAEMSSYDVSKLVITTESGKIYIYDEQHSLKTLLEKTLAGKKPRFLNFLNGILVITEADGLFYIKTIRLTMLLSVN